MSDLARHQFRCSAFAAVLAAASFASRTAAQAPFLVEDINAVPIVQSSDPRNFVTIGNETFFAAFSPSAGRELWKTDGTPAGTVLVKDINPGLGDSSPTQLVAFDGALFFYALGPEGGLWRSDGTTGGTSRVFAVGLESLTIAGDLLYFAAYDNAGRELWKSDGTAGGTARVKDINPGFAESRPRNMVDFGGTLFFQAFTDALGAELWKSDGTEAGTVLVKDIASGTAWSEPFALTVAGGTLFFVATESINGYELWKSDGSPSGTEIVEDINPGAASGIPSRLTDFGGVLLFTADDGVTGSELWMSDGSAAGTMLVKDINPGPGGSSGDRFTVIGTILFFNADDGSTGIELWKSDGSAAGTTLVKDINPGPDWSLPDALTDVNGLLLLRAADPAHGQELWRSDGTPGGTTLVADVCPGTCSGVPFSFPFPTHLNGTLLFPATDGTSGNELWASDGTGAGTEMLANIAPDDSTPDGLTDGVELIDFRGELMFTATDGVGGVELWTSDGTAAGTTRVKDINAGAADAFPLPGDLTRVGGNVFFAADDGVAGSELWMSDGNEAGTVLVKDIRSGPDSSVNATVSLPFPITITYPPYSAELDGNVLFAATLDSTTWQVWRSDGTPGGTYALGNTEMEPSNLTNVLGKMFFQAWDPSHGLEPWVSDGTPAGTHIFKDIAFETDDSSPDLFTQVGDTMYFRAQIGGYDELWRSDGTQAGTTQVSDFNPASAPGLFSTTQLLPIGATLFFAATNFTGSGATGNELYRIDGTLAGTVLVKDIQPGPSGSFPGGFVELGGKLFFSASGSLATAGALWTSDGTASGTVEVIDTDPDGPYGPYGMVVVNGRLFFAACDFAAGCEPWESDGTAAGTHRIADIMPGPTGSNPGPFVRSGPYLYFPATVSGDSSTGRELWALPIVVAGPCGNGILNTGEACDDGNTDGGDCCASDCSAAAASGTACDDGVGCTANDTCGATGTCTGVSDDASCDDGDLCTVDTCDGGSGCVFADRPPATSCRTAERSSLKIAREPARDARDRLVWRWRRGESTTPAELGDPTATTDYALCVYDGNGLALSANVAAGTPWQAVGGDGFKYEGSAGIRLVRLEASDVNRSGASLRGKGAALPDAELPLSPPVTVQLINDTTPLCLESVFGGGDVAVSDDTRFRANDP